jgi:hypothetical protein
MKATPFFLPFLRASAQHYPSTRPPMLFEPYVVVVISAVVLFCFSGVVVVASSSFSVRSSGVVDALELLVFGRYLVIGRLDIVRPRLAPKPKHVCHPPFILFGGISKSNPLLLLVLYIDSSALQC